MIFSLTFT